MRGSCRVARSARWLRRTVLSEPPGLCMERDGPVAGLISLVLMTSFSQLAFSLRRDPLISVVSTSSEVARRAKCDGMPTLPDAVRRVQKAVRRHLERRRRRQPSWFELEAADALRSDWGLATTTAPRVIHRRCPGIFYRASRLGFCGKKRGWCCRVVSLLCVLFFALAVYLLAVIVNLMSTVQSSCGPSGFSSCLKSVALGDMCSRQLQAAAQLHLDWRPWATVVIDSIHFEIRSDNLTGSPLAHGVFPGPTLSRGMLPSLVINATATLAEAALVAGENPTTPRMMPTSCPPRPLPLMLVLPVAENSIWGIPNQDCHQSKLTAQADRLSLSLSPLRSASLQLPLRRPRRPHPLRLSECALSLADRPLASQLHPRPVRTRRRMQQLHLRPQHRRHH